MEAMKQSGLNPKDFGEAKREPSTVKAYVEQHIEEGRVLEKEGLPAGVVSGIVGPFWTKGPFQARRGMRSDADGGRKDPLMAAAEMMQFMEEEAKKHPATVATVGQLSVKPGGVNVIREKSSLHWISGQSMKSVRDEAENNIKPFAERVCRKRNVVLNIEDLQRITAVPCSDDIRDVIREACRKRGVERITLPSGAGHDGIKFYTWPIGMIFTRSQDGISHNPAEWSSKEDCGKGTEILFETVRSSC